jgi:hypothetical protein
MAERLLNLTQRQTVATAVLLIGIYGDDKTRGHRQAEFGHNNEIGPLITEKTRLLGAFFERINTRQEGKLSSEFILKTI